MTKDPVINGKIKRLLTAADMALETESAKAEKRLLVSYRRALDDVQAQIARLYESTRKPTLTEMRKFNRLTSVETQIAEKIRSLTRIAVNMTHENIKKAFLASFEDTTGALIVGTGMELQFDRLPQTAIEFAMSDNFWLDALKRHNGLLLSDVKYAIERTLRENARQEIATGLTEGLPYSKIAKLVKERFDVAASRARMITFTEMHKSHSKGRLEGIHRGADAAGRLGLAVKKVWKHNHVGVPRPEHLAADGQPADPRGVFHVGGEALEAPGLGRDPANNINCHCSAQIEVEIP